MTHDRIYFFILFCIGATIRTFQEIQCLLPSDCSLLPSVHLLQVSEIMRNILQLKKPLKLSRVSRILVGPEVAGSRPVSVTFPTFSDREVVFKRKEMLKGSSLYISEDVTKYFKSCFSVIHYICITEKPKTPGLN